MPSRSGSACLHVERIGDVGIEKDPPDFVDDLRIAERLPDLLRHVLDAPVPLHQLQALSSGRCL